VLADAGRQFVEAVRIETEPRLLRVGDDEVDIDRFGGWRRRRD